jgi:dihydrofolate reductase
MRQLIVAEFISLDGVIQAPGGPDEDTDGGFTQGGWTWPYWHDDIGKRFFEPMAEGDPFGDAMNGIRKYVVSTTLHSAFAWRNSILIKDNVAAAVRELKRQPGKNILLDGSSELLHILTHDELVDEYVLHVYPVVLGGGKRLFPTGTRHNLQLVETEALPTGVVFLRYRRAG